MLRAVQAYGRVFNVRQFQTSRRFLCSGKTHHGPPSSDFEDEFEEMAFDIEPEEEDIKLVVDETPQDAENITPELASEMVSRMVAAASKNPTGPDRFSNSVLPSITPHTISVLRASRITTNEVFAPGAEYDEYPINRKVVADIDVSMLRLSAPASEALKILAGSRFKDDIIRIGCNKFRTSTENQAYAIARIDKLVRAAKDAVGDTVDVRKLQSWDDVAKEVSVQLGQEEQNQLDFLLSKKLTPTETVKIPEAPSRQLQDVPQVTIFELPSRVATRFLDMTSPVPGHDAAAESIARSLTSVISSASTKDLLKECMRLMGARNENELCRSLKSSVLAILSKKPQPQIIHNIHFLEEDEVLTERMRKGRRIQPRSPEDKLFDSMAEEIMTNTRGTDAHL